MGYGWAGGSAGSCRRSEPGAAGGAEILGGEKEIGTLEVGKLADVLVVDGDVLADIRVLQDRGRFLAVLQGGVVKAGKGVP